MIGFGGREKQAQLFALLAGLFTAAHMCSFCHFLIKIFKGAHTFKESSDAKELMSTECALI